MERRRNSKDFMLSSLMLLSLLIFALQGVSDCFLRSAEAYTPKIAISNIQGICCLPNVEKRDALFPLLADPDVASQDIEPKRQKGALIF